jgi:hypothetical protein
MPSQLKENLRKDNAAVKMTSKNHNNTDEPRSFIYAGIEVGVSTSKNNA